MNSPILITSFQPWRVHQRSNSSDDLVGAMAKRNLIPPNAVWLRHVPVSFDLAPVRVESEIMRLRPCTVICCGMAEKRRRLSVERQAKWCAQQRGARTPDQAPVLQTAADVKQLVAGTVFSEVSEDAGSYVCNHLYYNVLNLVNRVSWDMKGVFIHIPVLNPDNKTVLLQDFLKIVNQLSESNGSCQG